MKFKEMVEMTSDEILTLLRFVHPHARLTSVKWEKEHNYIKVAFSLPGDTNTTTHRLDFLPDNIYTISSDSSLDGEPLNDGNIMELYQKFMVAKGYSEVWLNNPFA